MAPQLLLEALAHWVKATPDKAVFTYLQDSGSMLSSITYKELDVRTAEIARYVLDAKIGLKKGDRALLVGTAPCAGADVLPIEAVRTAPAPRPWSAICKILPRRPHLARSGNPAARPMH